MRELVAEKRELEVCVEMRELEPKMRELVVCVREERARAGEERARAGEERARAEVCVREREHWVCVGDRERELGDV